MTGQFTFYREMKMDPTVWLTNLMHFMFFDLPCWCFMVTLRQQEGLTIHTVCTLAMCFSIHGCTCVSLLENLIYLSCFCRFSLWITPKVWLWSGEFPAHYLLLLCCHLLLSPGNTQRAEKMPRPANFKPLPPSNSRFLKHVEIYCRQ